jgi:hypothetical protein
MLCFGVKCASSLHLQGLVQKHTRFMIYVHSKGMMVDIISGSTSIDTEVATGDYQLHYTWAHKLVHPLVKWASSLRYLAV